MVTLDVKEEVIRLRAMDYSLDKIASTLSISKPTVIEITNEFSAEIDKARASHRNTITDDLAYTAQERSKLYRGLISKVHAEIISRDISAVPTERLFTILERTERSLSAIEQRTTDVNGDPFANLTDEQVAMIANSTMSVRIIDERVTKDDTQAQ